MVTENLQFDQIGFAASVRNRSGRIQSRLCVGLDPDLGRMPAGFDTAPESVVRFCLTIAEATYDVAAAFKMNFAFFEALGSSGWEALAAVRDALPHDVPVIADAKRADIGNTSRAYATAILDVLAFDAITVNPYLGWDSLIPFFDCPGKGVFVLCKTSNPGSRDLQDLVVDGKPLYERVARHVATLDVAADVGLVVGATHPRSLIAVRRAAPQTLFLVPGSGVQGGSAEEAMRAAGENALLAVSRDILYASSGSDFSLAARESAQRLARQTWDVAGAV